MGKLSTMFFSFATSNRIVFGVGAIAQAATHAFRLGKKALVITGRNMDRCVELTRLLDQAKLSWRKFAVLHEPDVDLIMEGVRFARQVQSDVIIGFGGGSVIDTAKAIAALCTNTQPIEHYLEIVGDGQPLQNKPLACIAIPTTAGTGSEVTSNAVILCPEQHIKVSLRHPMMVPDLAVVDPALTRSMPPDVTAATGCDALTQLMEAFVSIKANPLTDGLCREGLPRAVRSLETAFNHGDDIEARSDMALASLFSGLALANGGLGAVHGIAGPLGGMIRAPHGALCARLLPFVVETNIDRLYRRTSPSPDLARFDELAIMLTGSLAATASDSVGWLQMLIQRLSIPGLARWGMTPSMIAELAAKAVNASSMKGNPIKLSVPELTDLIRRAL
jgi:alcohol dehydrogenase class IV